MAKKTLTPDQLAAEEVALAQKLANFVVLIAIYFFKDKAKPFLEAVITGVGAADETQTVTVVDIIDAGADIDLEVATMEGDPVWIQLATIGKTTLDKIKSATFGLLDMIHDFTGLIAAIKEGKAESKAAAAQTATAPQDGAGTAQ